MWCHKPRDDKVSKMGKQWSSLMNTGKSSKMGLKNIYLLDVDVISDLSKRSCFIPGIDSALVSFCDIGKVD